MPACPNRRHSPTDQGRHKAKSPHRDDSHGGAGMGPLPEMAKCIIPVSYVGFWDVRIRLHTPKRADDELPRVGPNYVLCSCSLKGGSTQRIRVNRGGGEQPERGVSGMQGVGVHCCPAVFNGFFSCIVWWLIDCTFSFSFPCSECGGGGRTRHDRTDLEAYFLIPLSNTTTESTKKKKAPSTRSRVITLPPDLSWI